MKKRVLFVLCLVPLIAAIWYIVAKSQLPAVLDLARPVPARVDWGMWYAWMNDRDVIGFSGHNSHAFRSDTISGQATVLYDLNQSLSGLFVGWNRVLSPDSKTLLCIGGTNPSRPGDRSYNCVIVAGLDGTRSILPVTVDNAMWLPDGSGWVTKVQKQGIAHLRVYRPGKPGYEDIAFPKITGTKLAIRGGIGMLLNSDFVGFTEPSKMLFATPGYVGMGAPGVWLYEFDLEHPEQSRQFLIPKTDFGAMNVLALSPDGRRLAWITEEIHWPIPISILKRLHFIKLNPPVYCRIWTSKLDGSDRHDIAIQEVYSLPRGQRFSPYRLRWTPDGKRLSFIHGGRLYVVPVR